jgi:hypothetical protein
MLDASNANLHYMKVTDNGHLYVMTELKFFSLDGLGDMVLFKNVAAAKRQNMCVSLYAVLTIVDGKF